jgi:hypothetical protein
MLPKSVLDSHNYKFNGFKQHKFFSCKKEPQNQLQWTEGKVLAR